MRLRLVSILATGVLLLAVVAVALAAKPKAGYMFFAGSGLNHPNVAFKVSNNSKKLLKLSAALAIRCNSNSCGGFGGVDNLTINSVKVKKGKFKVTGGIYGAAAGGKHGKKLGSETVTGRFVSSTLCKGKVTTHIKLGSGPNGYHGVTQSYTAVGTPSTTG